MDKDELLQVGVLTQPHGVHGEVKVFPTTEDVKRFKKNKNYLLEAPDKALKEVHVTSVKFFKQFVILGFEEFDTPEEMALFGQCSLYVRRQDAIPLKEDEYFVADLYGLRALNDETGDEIGTVTDVLFTGANDVYEVRTPEGKTVLFPAIKDCVKEINLNEGVIRLSVLPGLMDE